MRRNVIIAAAALVALVVAIAVISAGKARNGGSGSASTSAAASTSSAGAGAVGSPIGRFVATDVDGHSVTVPTAGKPGAVWFFAGWCGECLPVGRTLGEVQAQLGSRVTITGISPDPSDSEGAIRAFRQQDGSPPFPFIWNSDGSLGQQYAVTALDTTLVYDARGVIVYRGVSPDLAAMQAAFRKAGIT